MAKRNYNKEYRRAKSTAKKISKLPTWAIVLAVIFIILAVGGYFVYTKFFKQEKFVPPVGDISFHFMMLGNNKNGDCTYIKAGDNDILIDAGSTSSSMSTIETYLNQYVKDGVIEYLIVSHAHEDHIANLGGSSDTSRTLFDAFTFGTIIDFPKTDSDSQVYQRYVANRDNEVTTEGAKHYTALECVNESVEGAKKEYELSQSVSMEILYQEYYEKSAKENNYSVCVQFKHGSRKFLFTGDLEEVGEKSLVDNNQLGQVELFKAGHHGSNTASSDYLLNVIKPKIVVVPGVVGYDQYTVADPNDIFPSKRVLASVAQYTSKVYVPTIGHTDYTGGQEFAALNGNIVVSSTESEITVNCSNNNTLLKDTAWCQTYRSGISWVA